MTHSKESICNGALGRLGKPPLVVDATAAQDYSDADHAVRAYDERIGRVLRSHLWNFATQRVALNADPAAPAFGFRYRYALPGNPPVAKVWGLDEVRHGKAIFSVEAGYVLTNEAAPLNLIYIGRITDPALFDDAFVDALEAAIAAKIAPKVLGSLEAADWFAGQAKEAARDARTDDAKDNPPREMDPGTWAFHRRTG